MNNKHYLPLVVVAVTLVVGLGVTYFAFNSNLTPQIDNIVLHPKGDGDDTENYNIYRNREWGFEFKYPKDWEVKENSFGSYYSKFNVVARPTSGFYSQFPILINIVLPEFPELSFQNIEKTTSEVTVSAVFGTRYDYKSQGTERTAIILPIREYKLILGGDYKRHEVEFNQTLSTFKFLK